MVKEREDVLGEETAEAIKDDLNKLTPPWQAGEVARLREAANRGDKILVTSRNGTGVLADARLVLKETLRLLRKKG